MHQDHHQANSIEEYWAAKAREWVTAKAIANNTDQYFQGMQQRAVPPSSNQYDMTPLVTAPIVYSQEPAFLSSKKTSDKEVTHAPNMAEHVGIDEKQPVNNRLLLLVKEGSKNEYEHVDNYKGSSESSKSNGSISSMNKINKLQENGVDSVEANPMSEGVQKRPSKSARRENAKRKGLKEMGVLQKRNTASASEGLVSNKKMLYEDMDNNKASAARGKGNGSMSNMKKINKLLENGVDSVEANPMSEGVQKRPSKRAWRENAKRKGLKEMGELQKKNSASASEGLVSNENMQYEDKDNNKGSAESGKGNGSISNMKNLAGSNPLHKRGIPLPPAGILGPSYVSIPPLVGRQNISQRSPRFPGVHDYNVDWENLRRRRLQRLWKILKNAPSESEINGRLPPVELVLTHVFKDNDVVSVNKKGKKKGAVCEGIHAPDIAEKQSVDTGPLVLVKKEPQDEEGTDPVKDSSYLENLVGRNAISKKRKASETLHSFKTKGDYKYANTGSAQSSRGNNSISGTKKNSKLQKNGAENLEATPTPEGVRKSVSRSAWRKNAKRQRLKEIHKLQKKMAASESEGPIDGSVFPPIGSTCIFKDKVVFSMKTENMEIDEKEPVNTRLLQFVKKEPQDEFVSAGEPFVLVKKEPGEYE